MKQLALVLLAISFIYWVVRDGNGVVVNNATVDVMACHCGGPNMIIKSTKIGDIYQGCNNNGQLEFIVDNGKPVDLTGIEKCEEVK